MNEERASLVVDICMTLVLALGGLAIYQSAPALLPFSVLFLVGSLVLPVCRLADYVAGKRASRKE